MIYRHRTARHWSQRTLANKLHISHTYVSQFERGRQVNITVSFLRDLMRVFDLQWDELVEQGGINVALVPDLSPQQEKDLERLERTAAKLSIGQVQQLIDYAEWLATRTDSGAGASEAPMIEAGGSPGGPRLLGPVEVSGAG
jgi:transcriptional regulator with XRE-family HTH domain